MVVGQDDPLADPLLAELAVEYAKRYGATEEAVTNWLRTYPAEEFAKNCPGHCEVAIIPDCDHFYVGAEDKVSKIVTEWLQKTLG